jgi:hypothetical protein
MAKQPKTAVAAPAAGSPPTPPAAPVGAETLAQKAERNKTDLFVRTLGADGKGVPAAKKLAPQAQLIVDVIEAAGAGGITREGLNEKLVPAGLKTRQSVGRIVTYYQKSLVEAGTITIAKGNAPTAGAPAAA